MRRQIKVIYRNNYVENLNNQYDLIYVKNTMAQNCNTYSYRKYSYRKTSVSVYKGIQVTQNLTKELNKKSLIITYLRNT